MSVLRVVSWNVRSLRDDARGVAAVLRALQPDVVLLQEAPRLLGWRTSCRRLARRAGLRVVVGGAPAAGNLLLAAPHVRPVEARAVRLARRPGLHRRGAVTAVLALAGGGRLGLLGTHLDLDPAARAASARQLRALLPDGVPLLVAADVNDEPGSPAWLALSAGLVDVAAGCGPTFPLRAPRRRIDGVFVDPALEVLRVDVPRPGPVTDHLPVVIDVEVRPG